MESTVPQSRVITGIFFGMLFEALVELFPKAKKFIRNILKLTLDFL